MVSLNLEEFCWKSTTDSKDMASTTKHPHSGVCQSQKPLNIFQKYIIHLFISKVITWDKKNWGELLQGFTDDGEDMPQNICPNTQQKVSFLQENW